MSDLETEIDIPGIIFSPWVYWSLMIISLVATITAKSNLVQERIFVPCLVYMFAATRHKGYKEGRASLAPPDAE